jgi:hypothetical protein
MITSSLLATVAHFRCLSYLKNQAKSPLVAFSGNENYDFHPPPLEPAVIRRSPMGEPSDEINRLAAHLPAAARAPFKERVWRDFEAAAAIAERGASAGLSASQIAVAIEDDTLIDRVARFGKRLREIKLPKGGFSTKEDAQAAGAFAKAFRDLQERETELGLPIREKPEAVNEAERLATAYYRRHTATGEFIPPRPRGRPRGAGKQAPSPKPS